MTQPSAKLRVLGKLALSTPILVIIVFCALWTDGQPDVAWKIDPTQQLHAQAPDDFVGPLPPAAEQSVAEQITRLQRSIDADQKYVNNLKAELEDPGSDYHRAESQFQQLDLKRSVLAREVQRLRQEGKKLEADKLQAQSPYLEENWQLARDQFNLAIQERQTIQEKIAALDQKIQQEKAARERLMSAKPSIDDTFVGPPRPVDNGFVGPPRPADLVDQAAVHTVVQPKAEAADSKPASKELVQAREDARLKSEAAREASEKATSVNQRLESLRKNIELERKLLDTARRKADQHQAMRVSLDKELKKKLIDGADRQEIEEVSQRIDEAQQKFVAARGDVAQSSDRLHELQAQLGVLQTEQLAALQEAERASREAKAAEEKVTELQNPFTPHNLVQWLLNHGARLLAIIIGMLVLSRTVRFSSGRIVQVMAKSGERGTKEERENRAQTLVGVFRNTAALIIICGGTLMLLEEAGIPIVPLMGGAAVLGLAVAFGAQNLIKDYFSGFMVLMEDQYGINDVIKVGDISGKVEKITLRVTVLRDMEGTVHFIPHGSITTVSNKTHGWSRAYFEIGVAYKEDCDEVMRLLVELGKDLRKDPKFSRLIMEDPEMLGVDSFGDSAVVIKFYMKTRPLQQWPVRREMLRRIKKKFDELGIEIPFPQRTVYHRHEGGLPAAELDEHNEAAA
ncbi:MAG: mechanosensitive ion channel domain-containing protein [Gemmataceae bacterium]